METLQGFRLSPQQRRLWQLQGGAPGHRAQLALALEGELDRELFAEALRQVFARHEILRTSFRNLPGMKVPVQCVEDLDLPSLEQVDVAPGTADIEAELDRLLAQDRGLGGSEGRLLLMALAPDHHILVVSLPALCADTPSLGVLFGDLCRAFAGELSGDDEILQYADFSEWQSSLLEGEEGEEGRAYWRGLDLAGGQALVLPGEGAGNGGTGFLRTSLRLDSEASSGLRHLAGIYGASLSTLLAAAWQTLLWRLTGEPEVTIGRLSDGRKYDDLNGAVGLFSRCLPCRASFVDNPTFRDVVEQVEHATVDADAWQEYFDPAAALFSFGFELADRPAGVRVGGLALSVLRQEAELEPFKIGLRCVCAEDGLTLGQVFDGSLYDHAAAERLLRSLEALLASALLHPGLPAAELEIVGAAERRQLLAGFNETAASFPADRCLHELFEEQTRRTPDGIALTAGGAGLSFRDLNQRANRLARVLRRLGVGPETPVALACERSPAMVVCLLGVLKSGGAYVPLDLRSPKSRLEHIIADAGAGILITEERLLPALPDFSGRVLCLDRESETLVVESGEDLGRTCLAGNLAYITYTSGSTGRPKGVFTTHRAAVNYLDFTTRRYGVERLASVLQVAAFSFDASVRDILGPLIVGVRVVLLAEQEARDPAAILDCLRREEAEGILSIVPTLFRALLHAAREADLPYGTVRLLLLSGEPLRGSDGEGARRLFREEVAVVNQYGPTECTMTSSFWPLATSDGGVAAPGLVPIGKPIQNVRFHVVDSNLSLVPLGAAGELCIGGEGLSRGYLRLPVLTAERFAPDPFGASGERLFRTGDLARYLPDGNLELLGRRDRQVKVRGVRVELDEIEALLATHPGLKEVAVTTSEAPSGALDLVAYVVGSQGGAPPLPELRAFLQEKLPDSMLPAFFVPLPALPRTRTGKVDRGALPPPDRSRTGLASEAESARTPLESLLAVLWGQVLGAEQMGVQDNFFEAGGHSLLAAQLVARVQDTCGVELPLRSIFEAPTVRQFATLVERALGAGGARPPALEPAPRQGPLPLSFAQQRLWFLQQLDPDTCAFNISRGVRLRGTLDFRALERAMSEVLRRHEALRTTFAESGGDPLQVIAPARPSTLPLIDLRDVPRGQEECERLAFELSRQPFDLVRGPLLRVLLLRLSAGEHRLLFTIHHIVSDDWSMQVLVRELSALYEAFSRGEPSPLSELAVQYVDFAQWQRRWLRDEVVEGHLAFWRQKLGGDLPVLNLPIAKPRPASPTYGGGRHSFLLPADLTRKIADLSRQEGVTLFMTLLAAFQTLLCRYSDREDILVGTDVANRSRVEIEPLIGFFVNLLVLRTDLGGDPTFRELLGRVREVTLGAYTHQDLPFEKIVEEIQPERTLRRAPLFQYLLVLQNPHRQKLELSGLTLDPFEIDNHTTKFDLVLVLIETGQGLAGTWSYSTDLFDQAGISRMSSHLENLLASAVAEPDARLSQLEYLPEMERGRQKMEKRQRKEADFARFLNVQPKAIKVSESSLVHMEALVPGQKLPLLIRPAAGQVDLPGWVKGHLPLLEAKLHEYGAILFRGFDLGSVAKFEELARTVCPELFGEYGDLPRDAVSGKIYSSTPYPPDRPILFHNESSQLDRWPLKQFFCCMQPAEQGGETPVVDCRKVYELLDEEIRERFARHGVMYVRNYTEGLDVDWRDFFHTDDRSVVEEFCRNSGIAVEWKAGGGLRTRKVCPAVARHPRTGEMLFFNQIQAHHVSCLPAEDREAMLKLFAVEDLPRNVYYGDGSPIEDSVMAQIIDLYYQLAVTFPWQKGDLLMVDNMLTAHGRYPYSGPRKIVVAMGDMISSDAVRAS